MITKGNTIKIIGIVLLIMISLIVLKYATYFVSTENRLCKGNFTATVKRVIDGDTIEMQECKEHIRFSLVNTPEYYQPGYKEAKDFIAICAKLARKLQLFKISSNPMTNMEGLLLLFIAKIKI